MFFSSALAITFGVFCLRRVPASCLVKIWLLKAVPLLREPFFLTLKRFTAPFTDFIFGIDNPFRKIWERNYTKLFLKFCYTLSMNSIKHIENALQELQNEVEKILLDWNIPLNEKDNLMLPLLQQKRVLDQTLEDLKYLKENPPTPNQPCGISKYREDN